MKLIRLSVWYVFLAALAWLPILGQETPEEEESAPPTFEEAVPILLPVEIEGGQKDLRLELVVHRWTDRGSQDEGGQHFNVSIKKQPAFMENIRWEEGPEIEFAPGEHSKTLQLIFDTAAAGATGEPTEEAQLVLLIEARHEAVIPPERELEIPLLFTRALRPGDGSISICALRDDTPEEFPIEQAMEYCDPDRQPVLRSDRIVLFFTPERDMTEPIRSDQYFFVRIVGPNGDSIYTLPFWNKGTEEEPELSIPFAAEGSPGRLAIPLNLWRVSEDPDPARARTGPGTYTIRTVSARTGGMSTFGQGERTPLIDGEWQDEGTFEIGGLRPVFAGFVAEDVNELPFSQRERQGTLTFGKPQVSGTSVSIDMLARWQRRPGEPEQHAASRLTLNFPEELIPDYSEVGAFDAKLERLEQTEDDSIFFTAGLHHLVTTNVAPPDRHLVEGGGIPKFWEALEYSLPEGRGGSWLWPQGETRYGDRPMEGHCSVQLELTGVNRSGRFGDPELGLASHLRDRETLWVIPVFYSLVDEHYSRSRAGELNVRSYGYALYAAEPYTGPGPAGRPGGRRAAMNLTMKSPRSHPNRAAVRVQGQVRGQVQGRVQGQVQGRVRGQVQGQAAHRLHPLQQSTHRIRRDSIRIASRRWPTSCGSG